MSTSELYNIIKEKIALHGEFYIADSDDEGVHHLLGSTPMKVGDSIEIIYDRTRDLEGSFTEGGLSPTFVLSHDKKFLGVMSDVDIFENGKKQAYYYSSDLRVDPKCKGKTRLKFRNCYKDIVADMPGKMFTCILDENKRAINALTKGKHFFYHKRFPYTACTTLMTPFMRRLSSYDFEFKVISKEEAKAYFIEHNKSVEFIAFHDSQNYFGVYKNNKLVGVVSADRSKFKKLLAHPLDFFSKACLFISKKVFKQSYEKEMPWVYLTNFLVSDEESAAKIIESFIKFLYIQKELKSGELFQFILGQSESLPTSIFPMIKTNGTLYEVSANEEIGHFYEKSFLNPLML